MSAPTVDDTARQPPAMREAPWVRLHPEAFDFMFADPDAYRWFVSYVGNPVSLRDLCRRTVRRRLGTPLDRKIQQIGYLLPPTIKNYLLMKDLDWH